MKRWWCRVLVGMAVLSLGGGCDAPSAHPDAAANGAADGGFRGVDAGHPSEAGMDAGSPGPGSADAGLPDGGALDAGAPDAGGGSACVPRSEVCDGLDDDCDGVPDNGLTGCDVCAPYHELPVVTHWSNALNAAQYLATDQATIGAAYPGGTYVPGTCYPYYAGGRIPDLDHYIGDTWSVSAISDADAKAVFEGICRRTGVPVRLLRPDAVEAGRLRSRPGAVQVVHANVVDGSLVTVVLPANWSGQAPAATWPIVANGFYDLNDNVFRQEGPDLIRMIALSTTSGRTGAIGVLWNGGGALASRTMNPRALDQFAHVVDFVAQRFGGDRHRILMYGGSRGGVTTLAMASNPKGHDYTVTYAAPVVPPTRIGEHALLQSTTFPGLLEAAAWSTGLADAWRTGWRYPACAGKAHLTGLTAPQAHLFILTGTTDPAYADAHLALISPDYVAGLKAAGTRVYMQFGSHDFIVPYAHEVEYAKSLLDGGVPLEVDVLIRAGHAVRPEAGKPFIPSNTNRIWEVLQAYVDPAHAGPLPTVTPKVSFYRVNRTTQVLEPFAPADGVFPFTLEGPRFTVPGQRFPLVMVGEPGTQWEVTLTPPGGGSPYLWTGAIGAQMKALQWVDVPVGQAPGDYAYGLRIKKPGVTGWEVVSATSTITGSPGVVTVVPEEPNVGGSEVKTMASGPALPAFPGTNWGLSEY